MRFELILLPRLVACTAQDKGHPREPLMTEIERTITLPAGARPLSAYAKHYAFQSEEVVAASFMVPIGASSGPCTVVMPGGKSRPCAAGELSSFDQGAPGSHRWHGALDDLPRRLWAGCEQVNVRYEVPTHRFLEVACSADN